MRLFDADAFRKWLCALFAGSGTHEDDTKEDEEWNASLARIITHLDEAPTVERPHGEWIPVEERLPEDDKEVLVYVRRKDGEKSEMNGLHIARRHQMEGDSEGNNNFWGVPVAPCEWRIEGWSYFFEPEVLAWMPLPEPYEEGVIKC